MSRQGEDKVLQRTVWAGVLTVATVASTYVLDCATPFAALIALAVLFLPRKDAMLLVGANVALFWVVGYGLMHWPFSMSSIYAIAELGLACGLSAGMAMLVHRGLRAHPVTMVVSVFLVAFLGYQISITALSSLRASHETVGLQEYLYLLYLNGLAFAGLLSLQGIATAFGLVGQRPVASKAIAGIA